MAITTLVTIGDDRTDPSGGRQANVAILL